MITFKNLNRQILLRAPEFQDERNLGTSLQVKTMMDSSVVTHRSKERTLFKLTFRDLSRVKAQELRDFYEATSGQRLTYTDEEGLDWDGYIVNEELAWDSEGLGRPNLTHDVRAEAFTTTIEFEVTDPNLQV